MIFKLSKKAKNTLTKKILQLTSILLLFIVSFSSIAATYWFNPNKHMTTSDLHNYYQGAYGFVDGFENQDPLESLDDMAKQNINLVILYGTNYSVKPKSEFRKDAVLEKQFKKVDRYLAHAHSLGIQVIMPVWRIPKNMEQVPYMNAGELDTVIRYIKRYTDNPTVIGWYMMDEPILRLESVGKKAPEYFQKYIIPAFDTLTEALDEYDTNNKLRFGVFERYNKGKYGLENGARILIERYLTAWGHDRYPFVKRSPKEFQNIYYVIRNFYALDFFVRSIRKPFLFVGQAQSSDANPDWQQRLPTEREFLIQQIYPMLLMSDAKSRYHLGNLVWAFGVMRATPAGRKFLAEVYSPGKQLIDFISPGIANGRIKDISQDLTKPSYIEEKAIKAGLYDIPQDSLIFQNKAWHPHPFRGKKMAVAIATKGGHNHNFSFTYPGKVNSVETPSAALNHICRIENFRQQYNPNKQETLLQMQIMPLCPTVLIFDAQMQRKNVGNGI